MFFVVSVFLLHFFISNKVYTWVPGLVFLVDDLIMLCLWLCLRIFQLYFPINKLRNLALENARTEFIFQVDVDFILSDNLEADVISTIECGFFSADQKV